MSSINYKNGTFKTCFFVNKAMFRAYYLNDLAMLVHAIKQGAPELLDESIREMLADILLEKHKGKGAKFPQRVRLLELDHFIWDKVNYFHGQGLAKYSVSNKGADDCITKLQLLLETDEFNHLVVNKGSYELLLARFKALEGIKDEAMKIAARFSYHKGLGDKIVESCNLLIEQGTSEEDAIVKVSEELKIELNVLKRYIKI